MDALAKYLYNELFTWIVNKLNVFLIDIKMQSNINQINQYRVIGALDIFGFEILRKNSFEQLCINYTNERLQYQFDQTVFRNEENVYYREKILFFDQYNTNKLMNNLAIIELVDLKKTDIFNVLDAQSSVPQSDDTKTPCNFPIILPLTPCLDLAVISEQRRCDEYFSNHVPELTPAKKRANPIKLYSPNKDKQHNQNITMMLEQSECPFDEQLERMQHENETKHPLELCDGDISLIVPVPNKNSSLHSFGNSFAIDQNRNDRINTNFSFALHSSPEIGIFAENPLSDIKPKKLLKQNIDSSDITIFAEHPLSDIKPKKNINTSDITIFAENPLSDIKPKKLKEEISDIKPKKLEITNIGSMSMDNDNDNEEELLSMDAMCDEEFFKKLETQDQCIQTQPVVVFPEEDIPKIRYEGKLLSDCDAMSLSAICYDEYDKKIKQMNASFNSVQSDKIIYKQQMQFGSMYTPILRHNKESIEMLDELSSEK